MKTWAERTLEDHLYAARQHARRAAKERKAGFTHLAAWYCSKAIACARKAAYWRRVVYSD